MADTLELESDFSLVETLEHFPVVWDPDNEYHDKVEQRRIAFREIARICKGETATVEDADYICKRYRAIRSKLVRRLKPGPGPMEVKHQHWALLEKLEFLKDKLGPKRQSRIARDLLVQESQGSKLQERLMSTTDPLSPQVSFRKKELPSLAPAPRYVMLPPPPPPPPPPSMPAPTNDIDSVFCQMLALSLKELPKDIAVELRGQIFQLLVDAQRQSYLS